MRYAVFSLLLLAIPGLAIAQTSTTPAIARETFAPQAEPRIPAIPPRVVAPPAVAEAVTAERVPGRVVQGQVPTRVTEREGPAVVAAPVVAARPVVAESAVVPVGAASWWTALVGSRYGFYDDAYVDDNWFYDYYEVPAVAAAVAVPRVTSVTPGYYTNWLYDPAAERALFSW
jgi:hypothetical protein